MFLDPRLERQHLVGCFQMSSFKLFSQVRILWNILRLCSICIPKILETNGEFISCSITSKLLKFNLTNFLSCFKKERSIFLCSHIYVPDQGFEESVRSLFALWDSCKEKLLVLD
jgi:hypothetical protein